MRDFRKLELALALAAALCLPAPASAQFDDERAANEGPGFKTGRLVLHPGLSIAGGYTTNVFLQDQNEGGSGILRLTGYLDVATEPPQRRREGDANEAKPQKIEFRGGLGASYYHYFDGRVPESVAGDAHIDFKYNPSEVFTLQVRDVFRRTIQPFTNADTLQGTTSSYGRNINTASLDLVGRSKSQVLEGRIGYTNRIEFFDASVFQYGNSLTHGVPVLLSWSFFPTSALVYQAVYDNQQYEQEAAAAAPTLLTDNNRVSNLIGYNGALTERFSLTAMIGYAAGFYQIADNFDGVIARLEARWNARPTIRFTAGFERAFRPSFIGNYVQLNRLEADTRFIVSGALQLGIRAWVTFDKSGLALAPDGSLLGTEPYRKDTRVYAGLFAEYRFKAWLALFGRVGYIADFTDFEYLGTQPLLDPRASYQRVDAWLGLRVFY